MSSLTDLKWQNNIKFVITRFDFFKLKMHQYPFSAKPLPIPLPPRRRLRRLELGAYGALLLRPPLHKFLATPLHVATYVYVICYSFIVSHRSLIFLHCSVTSHVALSVCLSYCVWKAETVLMTPEAFYNSLARCWLCGSGSLSTMRANCLWHGAFVQSLDDSYHVTRTTIIINY